MRLDHDERLFRLAELGIGCDEKGFRVGDVALLSVASAARGEYASAANSRASFR